MLRASSLSSSSFASVNLMFFDKAMSQLLRPGPDDATVWIGHDTRDASIYARPGSGRKQKKAEQRHNEFRHAHGNLHRAGQSNFHAVKTSTKIIKTHPKGVCGITA